MIYDDVTRDLGYSPNGSRRRMKRAMRRAQKQSKAMILASEIQVGIDALEVELGKVAQDQGSGGAG